jgi:hypothetical protein
VHLQHGGGDFDSNTATRLTTSTFDILKANPALGRAEALRRASLDYLNDRTNSQNAYPAHRGIMRMDQCVWRMSTRHIPNFWVNVVRDDKIHRVRRRV